MSPRLPDSNPNTTDVPVEDNPAEPITDAPPQPPLAVTPETRQVFDVTEGREVDLPV